ncbi:MAG: M14 family metallocarboxypeptidase [Akkermansiaceae bacterium]|jgi:murein peptide amidase A|nr:M14 family metallocarboxypeptidase [Akkermansiaceae bacterium]MDP4647679.1 M14 family metallocarboxypeptidase [Akkermansiaceae bacterium]MDP4722261.1 M14 family metallocarboxypeptidase [Akkermansiaceae bacterium]MDP4780302.1 M14 family metallocarboxypeptidase [Akkermansiaceae bacterium]MDP4846215.1 M14 family metallocarboxypeptidase [Akkermansiaceae bacterium]
MPEIFDWRTFPEEFSAAATACGFLSEIIAETEDGSVMAWERAGGEQRVYISAGIHGDEPSGPLALLGMMKSGFFSDEITWMICPALNPGGLALGTRENRSRIDLNRDYLVHDSLEVAAHSRWLSRRPAPDLFISLHEDWETEGFYFYEINLGEDRPERAAAILAAVKPFFPAEPGPEIDDHEVREDGWICHCAEADLPKSWPEAIYLAKNGCELSFTLETPSSMDLAKRVSAHQAAIAEILRHSLQETT